MKRTSLLILFSLFASLQIACGDNSPPQKGAIAKPDPNVESKDCFLEPRDFQASTADDVRTVANSPCTKVGDLRITNVRGLQNLEAFSRIETVEGALDITNNMQLESTEGLSVEGSVEDLNVQHNPKLEGLEGLSQITKVTGTNVRIVSNSSLQSLRGLRNLTSIDISTRLPGLKIYRNDLQNLEGLGELSMNGGVVIVQDEDDIDSLEGFGELGVVEGLILTGNENLESLEGLSGLEEVERSLDISSNPSLPTCAAERFDDRVAAENEQYNSWISDNGGYDHPQCMDSN